MEKMDFVLIGIIISLFMIVTTIHILLKLASKYNGVMRLLANNSAEYRSYRERYMTTISYIAILNLTIMVFLIVLPVLYTIQGGLRVISLVWIVLVLILVFLIELSVTRRERWFLHVSTLRIIQFLNYLNAILLLAPLYNAL